MTNTSEIPVLDIANVWCGNCGRHKFEHRCSVLVCLNCGTMLEWSRAWKEWYISSAPCLWLPGKAGFPSGTKWEVYKEPEHYHMIQLYNPNSGERLGDPGVIKELEQRKERLLGCLSSITHKLDTEVVKDRR